MAYTKTSQAITNGADIIDSRDVIARIEYLESLMPRCDDCGFQAPRNRLTPVQDIGERVDKGFDLDKIAGQCPECGALCYFTSGDYGDEDEEQEYDALKALAEEGESLSDWTYGEALIRESYFETYAQELAEDIGAIDKNATWPNNYIDWEKATEALLQDYTAIEFDGVTYYARG